MAAARTQLIQAQQAVKIAQANVAQFVGIDPTRISASSQRLLQLPAAETTPALDPAATPIAAEQNAAIQQAKAQLRALEHSYFPRFSAQAAAYAVSDEIWRWVELMESIPSDL